MHHTLLLSTSLFKHLKRNDSSWLGPVGIWRHASPLESFMLVYIHLSPNQCHAHMTWAEVPNLFFLLPSQQDAGLQKTSNAADTPTSYYRTKTRLWDRPWMGPDKYDNNSRAALQHSWVIWLLPELDTRLILWGDTCPDRVRFLLSLFRPNRNRRPHSGFRIRCFPQEWEELGCSRSPTWDSQKFGSGILREKEGSDASPGHAFHSHDHHFLMVV